MPQIGGAITALAGMIVTSFTLGYNVANLSRTSNPPPQNSNPAVSATPEQPHEPVMKQKVKVVFVDTEKRVYDQRYGESNAHFLSHHVDQDPNLSSLIEPVVKITGKEALASDIEREAPDLVVIHRSAFFGEKEADPNEAKLVQFLRGMTKSDILYVVYSRNPDTDGSFAGDLENRTGLTGRIYPYRFRSKNPFADAVQVRHFFNTILLLAHARLNQKQQSAAKLN